MNAQAHCPLVQLSLLTICGTRLPNVKAVLICCLPAVGGPGLALRGLHSSLHSKRYSLSCNHMDRPVPSAADPTADCCDTRAEQMRKQEQQQHESTNSTTVEKWEANREQYPTHAIISEFTLWNDAKVCYTWEAWSIFFCLLLWTLLFQEQVWSPGHWPKKSFCCGYIDVLSPTLLSKLDHNCAAHPRSRKRQICLQMALVVR